MEATAAVTRTFPTLGPAGEARQARLRDARLHVVVDTRAGTGDLGALLRAVAGASADVLRLRDERATEDQLRRAAVVFRAAADEHGALFLLSGFPGLAAEVGADGVHLDQVDVHPDHARTVCGPDLLIGRTVRSVAECDAAADEDIDYLTVGPVLVAADGYPAIGLEVVRHAARHAALPWAAGGGITAGTVDEVCAAGAGRIVVTRAVTDVEDPAAATWALRRALGRHAG